ncbi:MAG: 2-oxo-4-hydroxy-4-carboxy-5-ureidoimidazoline decarboxylase [Candidatus Limnocylindrales bacterium]
MAGPARLAPIEELNRLPTNEFAALLAPLFEGAARFLLRLAVARPFAGYPDLFHRALVIARAMPEAEQLELIDAHPRLGADPADVSSLSFREQGYGRSGGGATADSAELERLNGAYEARFGFRYCVFVDGRARADLLPGMAQALGADRHVEIERALTDIVAIAADRAARLGG